MVGSLVGVSGVGNANAARDCACALRKGLFVQVMFRTRGERTLQGTRVSAALTRIEPRSRDDVSSTVERLASRTLAGVASNL